VPTIRALLAKAHIANCEAACRSCPAEGSKRATATEEAANYRIAAE